MREASSRYLANIMFEGTRSWKMQASSEGRKAERTIPFALVGFPRPSLVSVSEPLFVYPVNVHADFST